MPKPSGAELLAYQLEQAHAGRISPAASPSMSAPPSSSFSPSSNRAGRLSGSSAADDSLPPTPATPWSISSHSSKPLLSPTVAAPVGLGIDPAPSLPPLPKLKGRDAVRRKEESEEEEETDDELEDELADFGYGARPRRRKEKKESLLDMLSSSPPPWMLDPPEPLEPLEVASPPPQRSGTFGRKLRQRFGSAAMGQSSSTPSNGSSGQEDPQAAFSTLRSSRSAGNLLAFAGVGFRKTGGGSLGMKHSQSHGATSRENLPLALSHSLSTSSYPHRDLSLDAIDGSGAIEVLDDFARPHRPPSPPLPKLAAKDERAPAASESTRELADFLRSSAPPEPYSPFGGDEEENANASSLGGAGGSGRGRSRSTLRKTRSSRSGPSADGERESLDTLTTAGSGATAAPPASASILKAAMVKLGASSRRASLTPFTAGALVPLAAAAPPSPGTPGTLSSEDGTGDIRVDKALMDGMFGFMPRSGAGAGASTSSLPSTATASASAGAEGRKRQPSSETGAMGVHEFVEFDQLSVGLAPTVKAANGARSRPSTSAGTGQRYSPTSNAFPKRPSTATTSSAPGSTFGGLMRSGSVGSETSVLSRPLSLNSPGGRPSYAQGAKKLSRKPVPSAIPPVEELLASASTTPTTSPRKPIRDETFAALLRLQDRGDTSPLAVGESPIKGLVLSPSARPAQAARYLSTGSGGDERTRGSSAPASPAFGGAKHPPLSPIPSVYSTPPLTPTPPSTGPTTSPTLPQPAASKASKRLSVAASLGIDADRPTSPPPDAPLPDPPRTRRSRESTAHSLSSAAHRLSLLPSRRSSSMDSVVDPPLTAAALPPSAALPPCTSAPLAPLDAPVFEALQHLRECMAATAALPLPTSAGSGVEKAAAPVEGEDLVRALLPTLKGLKQQMELSASLIGAVLARFEPASPFAAGESKAEEEPETGDMARVAELLLSGEGVEPLKINGEEHGEQSEEGTSPAVDIHDFASRSSSEDE
ncbi:hypothetical protein JCM10213_006516 [Rhodosporidiobolus nylandii]